MPSLIRFLIVLVILGILSGAGMIYLAFFVGPHTREMTVRISSQKLQAEQQPAPAQPSAQSPPSALPTQP